MSCRDRYVAKLLIVISSIARVRTASCLAAWCAGARAPWAVERGRGLLVVTGATLPGVTSFRARYEILQLAMV